MHTVAFYTRDGCHLCEVALEAVERVRARRPFELRIVDLDREAAPSKRTAYDHEVPVVELDGRKVMKYTVDEARLERLLAP
jgi:glutaredoxin